MAPPIWPFTLFFGMLTLILVGISLLLLYSTVQYPRRVLHTAGVRELAASIILLTAGAVIEGTFWSGLTASPWTLVGSRALIAACGVTLLLSAWNFARPFVEREADVQADDTWFDVEDDDG